MRLRRIFITTKDIMIITGKSDKYSRNLYRQARQYFSKKDHQDVTFREFCQYAGIPYKELEDLLNSSR